jgi:hypothetical protein
LIDLHAVFGPLLDLEEIAVVHNMVFGLFEPKTVFLVWPPIAHRALPRCRDIIGSKSIFRCHPPRSLASPS